MGSPPRSPVMGPTAWQLPSPSATVGTQSRGNNVSLERACLLGNQQKSKPQEQGANPVNAAGDAPPAWTQEGLPLCILGSPARTRLPVEAQPARAEALSHPLTPQGQLFRVPRGNPCFRQPLGPSVDAAQTLKWSEMPQDPRRPLHHPGPSGAESLVPLVMFTIVLLFKYF